MQVPAPSTLESPPPSVEDSGSETTPPKKGKNKPKKPNSAEATSSKPKPSILFLILDFLVFGGAVALTVLLYLKS